MSSDLIILNTHVDFAMDNTGINEQKPIFTIFGMLRNGEHVQVCINDFFPYFYAQPIESVKLYEEDLEEAVKKLEIKGRLLKVESLMSKSIYGYQPDNSEFFKLTFNNPHVFNSLKLLLEDGLIIGGKRVRFKLFESNFPFTLRFMVDMNISGMTYLKIKKYDVLRDEPFTILTSYNMIEPLPVKGDFVVLPPFKILSLDIECISIDRVSFPVAGKDPIIQIGCTLARSDSKDFVSQTIFCLKETSTIPGANVLSFETEQDLLLAWRDYFMEKDPDILIGYNIKGFDIPYILDRAETLQLHNFNILGRTNKPSKARDTMLSSRQFGSIAGSEITIEGRLIFDLLQIIRRDHKLRSYSLNSVSLHFLQEQKEDVPHSSMNELFETGPDTRRRIASYCLKDTVLPLRLFSKLNILINFTELARVTGVPVEYFSSRGTAIKVLTLIYKAARTYGFIIPVIEPTGVDTTYEGGFVMDPERGYYKQPIAVLDFSSLYPSIMISKNLCYTTLLSKPQYDEYGGTKTPTGDYFAEQKLVEGVLPKILSNLLTSRSATKKEMSNETDPNLKSCLNARQLAFKLCANSIYGFTGATVGKLPCLEISQSTTSFGREMIAFSKRCIEENFCKAKGFSHDSKVIYGDTDSVMIDFQESDMHRVFQMAKEISNFVTQKFIKPVSLEFEKVYSPYLLMNKKRYAGLIYTNPDKPSRIDTKGIETVRRDNCALVKNVIENSLNKILFDKDVEGAKTLVKNTVRDLYQGKIDLSMLVISKGITKAGEKYASKQAHIELAKKMKERGDEGAGAVGNRVAYIMVERGKKVAGYDKAEDPVYVLENNLPIDTEYYITQQLEKPLHRLFEPIVENVSELLKGEHTRTITTQVQVKGPLNAFLKKTTTCVGCKSTGAIICHNCREDFYKHLIKLQRDVEEKKEAFSDCWTECQRCQGSINDDILCENRDCPIFYRRTRVKKELLPLEKKLHQLRNYQW